MSTQYLETPIVGVKLTPTPRYGIAADGYTLRSGAPTNKLIQLQGESRWRRLLVWQFSNNCTLFVRIKGVPMIVNESSLPSFGLE